MCSLYIIAVIIVNFIPGQPFTVCNCENLIGSALNSIGPHISTCNLTNFLKSPNLFPKCPSLVETLSKFTYLKPNENIRRLCEMETVSFYLIKMKFLCNALEIRWIDSNFSTKSVNCASTMVTNQKDSRSPQQMDTFWRFSVVSATSHKSSPFYWCTDCWIRRTPGSWIRAINLWVWKIQQNLETFQYSFDYFRNLVQPTTTSNAGMMFTCWIVVEIDIHNDMLICFPIKEDFGIFHGKKWRCTISQKRSMRYANELNVKRYNTWVIHKVVRLYLSF